MICPVCGGEADDEYSVCSHPIHVADKINSGEVILHDPSPGRDRCNWQWIDNVWKCTECGDVAWDE